MARKYSKTRDFRAKRRKSRKIEGQFWTHRGNYSLKSNATKRAKTLRKKGLKARIVKITKGYGVYSHTYKR